MNYSSQTQCGILIPYYNTPDAVFALLKEIPSFLYPNTLVVDDGSSMPLDGLPCPMIRHSQNKGYGAAQKTGYNYFLYDHSMKHIRQIAMVHGDNQYLFASIWQAAQTLHPVQLGSRYRQSTQTPPTSPPPFWRKWGNHLLTGFANQLFETDYTDLHTGARIYSRDFLQSIPFQDYSDDFLFDQQALAAALHNQIHMREFTIPINYEDGVSSISALRSMQYGLGCIHTLWAAKRAKF